MSHLTLLDWRRTVSELYGTVRQRAQVEPEAAWQMWRDRRDTLFADHPQSPLTAAQKATFTALPYFGYRPAWRKFGRLSPAPNGTARLVSLPEGQLHLSPIGHVTFDHAAATHTLTLYWIDGYGGGLFLPFGDLTNRRSTYGGGRYLFDSIKGADLGQDGGRLILDFNFAYNPSCAYSSQWVCPLAPDDNKLAIAIEAGERHNCDADER